MSLLIKGVEVSPDHIQGITVFPEGFAVVEEYEMLVPIKTTKCEVASVPTPHGRLIDADNFIVDECQSCDGCCEIIECDCLNCKSEHRCDFMQDIINAPTVIEAEEGGKERP